MTSGAPFSVNHSTARLRVSCGEVVGKRNSSTSVPLLPPTATTVFVPPSSIAAIMREVKHRIPRGLDFAFLFP